LEHPSRIPIPTLLQFWLHNQCICRRHFAMCHQCLSSPSSQQPPINVQLCGWLGSKL
jgi:hypothetical protein